MNMSKLKFHRPVSGLNPRTLYVRNYNNIDVTYFEPCFVLCSTFVSTLQISRHFYLLSLLENIGDQQQ
jgi:hypothetical protein